MPAGNNRKRMMIGAITAIVVVAGVIGLAIGLTSNNSKGSGGNKPQAQKDDGGGFNIKSLVEGILQTAPTTSSSSDQTTLTTVSSTPSILPVDQKPALTFAQEVDQRDQTALIPSADSVKAIMSGKSHLPSDYVDV